MPAPCTSQIAARLAAELLEEYGRLRVGECGGAPVGSLVAVEGIDGSGTSTHSRILAETLRIALDDGYYRVVHTKEPTGGPIGFLIWEIVKGYLGQGFNRPDILAHLFAADRIYHLYEDTTVTAGSAKGVVGALVTGHIVIMERYKYSSIAYQAAPLPGGLPLSIEDLMEINRLAPPAHILVYLDVDPLEAAKRIIAERGEIHLYEHTKRLASVRANYLRLLKLLEKKPEWPAPGSDGHSLATPPWYTLTPRADCIYQYTRLPIIVKIDETGHEVENVAKEVVNRTVGIMLENEMLYATR